MTISLSVDAIVDSVLAISALARSRGSSGTDAPELLCRRESAALGRLAAQAFGGIALQLMPYVASSTGTEATSSSDMLTLELQLPQPLQAGAGKRIAELLEGAVTAELFRRLWAEKGDTHRAGSYAAMVRESLDLLVLRLRGAAAAAHPGLRTTPWGAWSW